MCIRDRPGPGPEPSGLMVVGRLERLAGSGLAVKVAGASQRAAGIGFVDWSVVHCVLQTGIGLTIFSAEIILGHYMWYL